MPHLVRDVPLHNTNRAHPRYSRSDGPRQARPRLGPDTPLLARIFYLNSVNWPTLGVKLSGRVLPEHPIDLRLGGPRRSRSPDSQRQMRIPSAESTLRRLHQRVGAVVCPSTIPLVFHEGLRLEPRLTPGKQALQRGTLPRHTLGETFIDTTSAATHAPHRGFA